MYLYYYICFVFCFRVSYIEIYNETVRDLLNIEKENIKIHDTIEGIIKVDVTEKVTSTPEEIMEVMREVITKDYFLNLRLYCPCCDECTHSSKTIGRFIYYRPYHG